MQTIDKLDVILQNEDQLSIWWHPGCGRSPGTKHYYVGAIGRQGPAGSSVQTNPQQITKIPSAVSLTIGFDKCQPNISQTVYNEVLKVLEDLICEGDEIEIKNKSSPRIVTKQIGIKIEHLEDYLKIVQANQEVQEKFDSLMLKLQKIASNLDDARPYLKRIPDNFYITSEEIDCKGSFINVCCDSSTKFYKYMLASGLLEKYFPAWYRDGNF